MTYVILTGGSSRRLGRDKATTHVGGQRLLDRLLERIPAGAPVVVVGPEVPELPREVVVVREEPAGAGPLAAIAAAAPVLASPLVAVVAADMPFAAPVVARVLDLLAADSGHSYDAVLPVDPGGRMQPLAGAYRRDALLQALDRIAEVANKPVRELLGGLRVMQLPVAAGEMADVDTAGDLRTARLTASEEDKPVDEWLTSVSQALGLQVVVDVDAILDVARDAAHNVERPAAPLTTYLLGAAVASGADPAEAAGIISALAADWPQRTK